MYSKQIFEKHAALLRSLFSGIQKNLMAAAWILQHYIFI
jgi:hypothetical protein